MEPRTKTPYSRLVEPADIFVVLEVNQVRVNSSFGVAHSSERYLKYSAILKPFSHSPALIYEGSPEAVERFDRIDLSVVECIVPFLGQRTDGYSQSLTYYCESCGREY